MKQKKQFQFTVLATGSDSSNRLIRTPLGCHRDLCEIFMWKKHVKSFKHQLKDNIKTVEFVAKKWEGVIEGECGET